MIINIGNWATHNCRKSWVSEEIIEDQLSAFTHSVLIVSVIIVDISSKVNDDPNFVLFKHDLDYILNDNLGKPCVLIFKFGWSKYFNQTNKYLGVNEQQKTLNFPGKSILKLFRVLYASYDARESNYASRGTYRLLQFQDLAEK